MNKIFFDLDGTLIHAHTRLYRLFQHLVPESQLSYDQYWDMKRRPVGHAGILRQELGWGDEQIALFEQRWLGLIEAPEWLALDYPLPGVEAVLQSLQGRYECYVVTARQFEDRAVKQIADFGWSGYFERIFVTGRDREKYDLIHGTVATGADDWYVGDTGIDIRTGKKLGVRTVGVLSGFRSEEALRPYGAEFIVDDVRQFADLLIC